MDSENSLNQFIDLAREWSLGYTKIIRTHLAFKREGKWHLEHSHIAFFSDLFDEVDKLSLPENVETKSLLAIKEVINFDKAFLDDHFNPKTFCPFSAPNEEYEIIVPNEVHSKVSYYFEPFTRHEFPGNWRWPALTANTGSNLSNHHLPHQDQLDLELFGHALPYSGLSDLFDTFGIPQTIMQQGHSAPRAIWIITHPATILPSSSIENEIAKIIIRCPKALDHEHLSLGVRILTGQPPIVRKTIPTSKIEWKTEGDWKEGFIEEPVESATVADIHLSFQEKLKSKKLL